MRESETNTRGVKAKRGVSGASRGGGSYEVRQGVLASQDGYKHFYPHCRLELLNYKLFAACDRDWLWLTNHQIRHCMRCDKATQNTK